MPKYLDTGPRADAVGEAFGRLITRRGLVAPSLRAVAADTGISPAALIHQFGSRERLVQVAAQRVRLRWLADLRGEVRRRGLPGFLPDTEDALSQTRVWLAWVELGRSDDHVAGTIADGMAEERYLLNRALPDADQGSGVDRDMDGLETTGAAALLSGLRDRLCSRQACLTPARAPEIWTEHLAALP